MAGDGKKFALRLTAERRFVVTGEDDRRPKWERLLVRR